MIWTVLLLYTPRGVSFPPPYVLKKIDALKDFLKYQFSVPAVYYAARVWTHSL